MHYCTTLHSTCFVLSRVQAEVLGPKSPHSFVPSSCVRDEHVCKQISSAFFVTKQGEHDQTHNKILPILE